MFIRHFLSLLLLLLPGVTLAAPVPLVSVDPPSGTATDTFELSISIPGKPGGRISPPKFADTPDFSIASSGTTTSRQNINGQESYQVSFTFQVTPRSDLPPGEYHLPEGSMRIDDEEVAIGAGKLRIVTAEEHARDSAQVPGMAFVQIVDNDHPYVGEQVLYRAELATTASFNRATIEDLKLSGLLRETLNQGKERIRSVGSTTVHSVMEVLFPLRAGEITIPPRSLVADVIVQRPRQRMPRRGRWNIFDDVFANMGSLQELESVPQKLVAREIVLHVQDLPSAPVGVSGYIPVGDLNVKAAVDQRRVKQGESVTLTVELVGTANLRPYELPKPNESQAKDFKIYVDKPDVETLSSTDRLTFRKVYKVALVPLRAGTLQLPVFNITSFNPKRERYENSPTPDFTLEVIADPTAAKVVSVGAAKLAGTDDHKQDIQVLGEDILPQHIGPNTLAPAVTVPRSFLFVSLLFPPLLAMIAFWYSARRKAELFDPNLGRERTALKRTSQALQQLAQNPPPDWAARCVDYIQGYFGDRFRITGSSLTSVDAEKLVLQRTGEQALSAQTAALFSQLQRIVYGAGSGLAEELIPAAEKLIQEIHRHAR